MMIQTHSYRFFLVALIALMGFNMGYGRSDTIYHEDKGVFETGVLVDGFKDGYWISYNLDGSRKCEGTFDKGLRTGEWIWYHANGKTKAIEKWRRGVYKKGEYWDCNGNPSDISEALTNPEYPGGLQAFVSLISENITYPEEVQEDGVEGRVVLKFQINRNGKLVNPVVAQRAHPKLNKEALRVIQLSGNWIPAEFHGVKTPSTYTFPISFALQ